MRSGGPARPGRRPHTLALVVYDGVSPLELGAACDIFGHDYSSLLGVPWYRLLICSTSRRVLTDGGLEIAVPSGLEVLETADTVVVAPTELLDGVPPEVLTSLRRARSRGCRVLSLCTGAFVLAAAGLLDGRRATTHWALCGEMARRYPAVTVDPGVLFVDEGDVLTSAGSAASIDLCLHLVRRDHGAEVATRLARELVVPLQRDGGQAQYIDTPLPVPDDANLFSGTIDWLREHLDEPVTIRDLAGRSAMSPRTFARRFSASTGTTPYQWIVSERVRLAQRLLETSDVAVDVVAARSGFSTAANLRKHFHRVLRTSPQAYRWTFRARIDHR